MFRKHVHTTFLNYKYNTNYLFLCQLTVIFRGWGIGSLKQIKALSYKNTFLLASNLVNLKILPISFLSIMFFAINLLITSRYALVDKRLKKQLKLHSFRVYLG